MKKVLIIEDDIEFQNKFKELLWDKIELLQARTLEEAKRILVFYWEELDYICLDFYLDKANYNITSVELTLEIKQRFKKVIMIAISSHEESRETQRMLGCKLESTKDNLPELILSII